MFKRILSLLPLPLLVFLVISIWKFPAATSILGAVFLLASLAIPTFSIFEKHKDSGNSRAEIAKEVLVLVITLLLIIFLGGLVGLFANYHVSQRFGTIVGFIAAIVSSFLVGYLVKKGMGQLSG